MFGLPIELRARILSYVTVEDAASMATLLDVDDRYLTQELYKEFGLGLAQILAQCHRERSESLQKAKSARMLALLRDTRWLEVELYPSAGVIEVTIDDDEPLRKLQAMGFTLHNSYDGFHVVTSTNPSFIEALLEEEGLDSGNLDTEYIYVRI